MRDLNNLTFDETAEQKPAIYSRQAVWAFSVIFAPIFGGFLLRQNLIESGSKKTGNMALAISAVLTLITYLVINSLNSPTGLETIFMNMSGGLILSELIYRKFFPDGEVYNYKKIWKALIISLLITIPFIVYAIIILMK